MENPILSLLCKIQLVYLILGLRLLGQYSRSPDELDDTHIGRNYMHTQFLAKLHVHAIFEELQLCQYGCLSTRLDFRNAFLGDEDPKKSNQLDFA